METRDLETRLKRILVSDSSRQPSVVSSASPPIDFLTDDLLLNILRRAEGESAWQGYALVCKRWSDLRRSLVYKLRFEKNKQRWREADIIRTVRPFRNLLLLELSRGPLSDDFLRAASAYLNRLQVLIVGKSIPPHLSFSAKGLDGFFRAMPQLKELVLPHTWALEFPVSVSLLSSLTKLCCSVSPPPDGIEGLTSLKYLDLCSTALPAAAFQLLQLTTLVLRGIRTRTLPPGLAQLAGLKQLTVKNSHLTSLPEEVTSLVELQHMRLLGCYKLKTLPHAIGNLKQLKSLELIACSMPELPSSISNLRQLSELTLFGLDNLTDIPESLTRLTALSKLQLDCNDSLAEIPTQLLSLPLLSVHAKKGIREAIDRAGEPDVKASLATKAAIETVEV